MGENEGEVRFGVGAGVVLLFFIAVIVDKVPVCRNQTALIAWHRPSHRACLKFMLSAFEQTA